MLFSEAIEKIVVFVGKKLKGITYGLANDWVTATLA